MTAPETNDLYAPEVRIFTPLENLRLAGQDFSVDPTRAKAYISIVFPYPEDYYPSYDIPIGSGDCIHFGGPQTEGMDPERDPNYAVGGIIDRDMKQYLTGLFPDVVKAEGLEDKYPAEIFGGCGEVFAPGNTVLDLGAGRAIGPMQLALAHPEVSFICIDKLYKQLRAVFPGKPGLQLTHADWENLCMFSDQTLDAIFSIAGKTAWGQGGVKDRGHYAPFIPEAWLQSQREYHRVLKPGGIVRFTTLWNYRTWHKYLCPNMWDCYSDDNIFILRKK